MNCLRQRWQRRDLCGSATSNELLSIRRFVMWVFCALCCNVAGCSSWLPEPEEFGVVKGVDAARSPNGLAVHRELWRTAGAKVLTPQRLSPRLDDMDVLVFVGANYSPPGRLARLWVDEWLAAEPGRSVIYFGRDFNASTYYREETLPLLQGEERRFGRIELAERQAEDLSLRVEAMSQGTFCDWFFLDLAPDRKDYPASRLSGPWSADLSGLDGSWPVGITLREPAPGWQDDKPAWLTKPGAASGKSAPEALPPLLEESVTQQSVWTEGEYATADDWDEAFQDLPDSRVLLSTDDGRPLVFELTHDGWARNSKILIVANGAPILNASLIQPLHRAVGTRLVEHCQPASRVGLLSYDSNGITISSFAEQETAAAGLEVLTVWPLSAVTMPAAFLGIVVCASLIPILGRAQRLRPRSVTDFGLHIDALGKMFRDSQDDGYAKRMIRDYFRKVKSEVPPGWCQIDETAKAPSVMRYEQPPASSGSATKPESPPPVSTTSAVVDPPKVE
ncbi:MAG: hypothetical protein ACE361_04615 [Aureliella sp.]